MREILFRAKSVGTGEWVYGCYVFQYGKHLIFEKETTLHYYIDERTVGQYTGITDHNGKKIFEGDIIKTDIYYDIGCYPHEETEIREVKYIDGCFYPFYDNNRETTEVIGNIHDNPELLEGNK